ncbi:MAG TPA: hypothetical protein G4N96_06930 [Chloroflexi bacterium]|nr:hypothetical protein [Chloroflexota bacterium]
MTQERKRAHRGERKARRVQPNVASPGLSGGWYKPLRDEDIERIHEASLTVLERTGIEVMPSECRDIFKGNFVGGAPESVDVIDEVCRGEGHFLATDQSLQLMNTEYYYPHTGDRQIRGDWEAEGSQDMWSRAKEKAGHILKTHRPNSIPAEVDAAIRERFEILLPVERFQD